MAVLYPGAGERPLPVGWLTCTGAEGGHTAHVAVSVSDRNAHDAAHGHIGFLI